MKTDDQLRAENPELYKIAREGGTERPGSSALLHAAADGVFHCAVCDTPLFAGTDKFDSGSGWPSFTEPINDKAITYIEDDSHGMRRTEVRCANCNAHLGHVFPDGPAKTDETGKIVGRSDRYCINGVCLLQEES